MYDDFKTVNYSKALVSPELFARHLSRLVKGDVIDGFTVTPGTGLQVVLAPGNALIRYGSSAVASARLVSLVNNFNLTIGTADVSNPRIDLVVLYTDNAVSLPSGTPTTANLDGLGVSKAKIVAGTPNASPNPANSTAIQASVGSGNPYTVLAQVRVNAGVSVIASDKITDVRALFAAPSAQHHVSTDQAITGSSGVFQDLATVGPTVIVSVPASGKVRVTISAGIYGDTAPKHMGVAASGANTFAASNVTGRSVRSDTSAAFTLARTFTIDGLTPGLTTFTAKYMGTITTSKFFDRELLVEPMERG